MEKFLTMRRPFCYGLTFKIMIGPMGVPCINQSSAEFAPPGPQKQSSGSFRMRFVPGVFEPGIGCHRSATLPCNSA